MRKTNIVLIGLRGSGKSSVARILGKLTKKKTIDTDYLIEHNQKQTIKDLVAKNGWDHFRRLERLICQKLKNKKNLVISTGGGLVCNHENIQDLKANGWLVYLDCKLKSLVARIKSDGQRPALTNEKNLMQEMKLLFKDRDKLYRQAANCIVDTTDIKPLGIAQKIIAKYHEP